MIIRNAGPADAPALAELYEKHLAKIPSDTPPDFAVWGELLARFQENPLYHLLVAEEAKVIVSSVTLVVVENLTHGARPYALIENVVTHAQHRRKGIARSLIGHACNLAQSHHCYKVMLLTGATQESTLRFYRNCGFNSEDKTAFIQWLS